MGGRRASFCVWGTDVWAGSLFGLSGLSYMRSPPDRLNVSGGTAFGLGAPVAEGGVRERSD
ncbi:hypothetical protein GCM10017600_86380 [Streptosporangium carneum]|uniref:Uncharacterized protein n=1 Tax=Streptosporangium carneum TaxID=47481 RepID=A0A9W6IAR0_9ACTN|nr:hypothetical protein GCM10017600_86380 [Streptosporangium carneum]